MVPLGKGKKNFLTLLIIYLKIVSDLRVLVAIGDNVRL